LTVAGPRIPSVIRLRPSLGGGAGRVIAGRETDLHDRPLAGLLLGDQPGRIRLLLGHPITFAFCLFAIHLKQG
jgi:hypothetical protein